MFELSFFTSYTAGIISFFAPCIVPLLPSYISYLLGNSLKEFKDNNGTKAYIRKILNSSFMYVLGFSLIFTLTGLTVTTFSLFLRRNSEILLRIGGFIVILLGLRYSGFRYFRIFGKNFNVSIPNWLNKLGNFRPFVVGIIFAIIWLPCIGPVFGSILALSAVSATMFRGAALLFVYSLGISTPFLIISLTLIVTPKYLRFIRKNALVISKVSGIILSILGLLLLTDTYKYLYNLVMRIF